MRPLILLVVLGSALARAQTIVPAVTDAQGLTEAAARKVLRAAEAALKASTSLTVGEAPAPRKGKRCDEACAKALATEAEAQALVLLELKALDAKAEKVAVDLTFFMDGEKRAPKHAEGPLEGADAWLKPALEAALPGYARKGFGALAVVAEPGSVVKVDGRVLQAERGEAVALTAGVHQVDTVFPSGHAWLERVQVKEGATSRLEPTPLDLGLTQDATASTSGVRVASYAVWMVGAAAIAGGLLAGALAKNTAAGLTPCRPDTRDCPTLDLALERNRQAQGYVSTGNVLLGVGAGLAAVGAGLFVLDVTSP